MNLIRERAPSIPVPENISFWVDKGWDRTFLIMRRVHGVVLDDIFLDLSTTDQIQVTTELADYVKRVSEITAPYLQSADGEPLRSTSLLNHPAPLVEDTWDPIHEPLPGPLTVEEFRAGICQGSDGVEPPAMDSEFHLYHNDMSPGNIILSGTDKPKEVGKSHVHVAGIIDWERAGFYPKFWISYHLKVVKPIFYLSLTLEQIETLDSGYYDYYGNNLMLSLERRGFPKSTNLDDWWSRHREGSYKVFNRRPKRTAKVLI